MLEVRGLTASYGPIVVLRGIDLTVGDEAIVAMIGPNGAGKSTALNAIAGMMARAGDVLLDGEALPTVAEEVVRRGLALVPQGRKVFPRMTVEENLYMGAYAKGGTWKSFERRATPVFDIFPRLRERREQAAGSLSGGEQQMLVIGRALLSEPRVLLIDELSLGLAPRMVEVLLETIVRCRDELGTACLLVEQAATAALDIAGAAYLLRKGEVVYEGPANRLRGDVDVLHGAYFGTEATEATRR
ncbi:MAG: branched-chain amino acid transport system ATP-binding protein [Actinomycetota bacterium]|nr:branched-chain amino acid transport system ATP-binding protein [Actinomycetota bacterium]